MEGFTTTYINRDYAGHMAYFFPDARENGKPIADLKANYINLFTKTEDIDMKIFDYAWTKTPQGVSLTGSFVAKYSYTTGTTKNYFGEVTFLLRPSENDELKITKLNYSISK